MSREGAVNAAIVALLLVVPVGAWLADERDDLTGAIDCLQRAVARDPALVDARERLRGLIRRLSTRA